MSREGNESATEDIIYNVARSEYAWAISLVWGDSLKFRRLEIANEPFVYKWVQFRPALWQGWLGKNMGLKNDVDTESHSFRW